MSQNVETRVAIVGGGVVGLSVARELHRRGVACRVVTWPRPGIASTAAAGMLAAQAEATRDDAFFRYLWGALGRYESDVAELGGDVGFRRSAMAILAFDEAEAAAERRKLAWQDEARLPIEWLDGAELVRRVPEAAPPVAAAWLPQSPQVEPRRLWAALDGAARAAGLVIDAAGEPQLGDGTLSWPGGSLRSDEVVVCSGAFAVAGVSTPQLMPVRGQLIEYDLVAATTDVALLGRGGYLLARGDGRVIVGSTAEEVGYDATVDEKARQLLMARGASLWPILDGKTPATHWSGLRPATPDRLPLIGRSADGRAWLATGLFRNGILLCFAVARTIADALTLGTAPPPQFSPLRTA